MSVFREKIEKDRGEYYVIYFVLCAVRMAPMNARLGDLRGLGSGVFYY